MYTDENLTCSDCGNQFVFSAGEQEFFAQKGFANKPNRCRDCRIARKGSPSDSPREMHPVVCSNCGKQTQVPFVPRNDKPVYCRDCFAGARRA